jgi:hypothetical protein
MRVMAVHQNHNPIDLIQNHRCTRDISTHHGVPHHPRTRAKGRKDEGRDEGEGRSFLLIYIIHHAFIHSCSIITSKEGTSILSYPVICIYLLGHRDRGDVRITQIRRIEVHCCIGHVRMHDHKSRSLSIRITAFTPSHDRSGDVRSLYRKPYSCRRRRQ